MATHTLQGGRKARDAKRSEMRSASTSCGGSVDELVGSMQLMGDYYQEADPVFLCCAIVLVYDRWIEAGKKPGSDNLVNCTRTHRKYLVEEITAQWESLAGVDPCDDLFPYHESYVVRKWIDFRKMPDSRKASFISAAKSQVGAK